VESTILKNNLHVVKFHTFKGKLKTQTPNTNINFDSHVLFPVSDIAENTQRHYKMCMLCSL